MISSIVYEREKYKEMKKKKWKSNAIYDLSLKRNRQSKNINLIKKNNLSWIGMRKHC